MKKIAFSVDWDYIIRFVFIPFFIPSLMNLLETYIQKGIDKHDLAMKIKHLALKTKEQTKEKISIEEGKKANLKLTEELTVLASELYRAGLNKYANKIASLIKNI